LIWTRTLTPPIYGRIDPQPLPPPRVCPICKVGGVPYYEPDGTRSWTKCDQSKHFPELAD
jgi:hypothetical protein